jgi:hypothetical protein
MKMAPEVNRFIKNREYERPQKTTLQKGADLLGKAAIIGGALAAGHAIGGGFRGKTAENVGKVADVVQNLAKTGVVGAEGGDSGLDFGVSGGSPVPYGQPPISGGNIDLGGVDNIRDRSTALADSILNRPGGDLDRLDDFGGNIPPNIGGGDTILPKKPDGSAQIVNKADEVDAWLAKNQWIRSDAGITGKGHGNIGQEKEWLKEELDTRKELETGLTSEQRQQIYKTGLGSDEEEAEERRWNLQLDAMARDRDPDGPPPEGGGGTPLDPAPTPASPTDIVSPDDPGVQRLSGGIQQGKTSTLGRVGAAISGRARSDIQKLREEPFGAQKEKAAARDLGLMILGRGMGLGPQGGRPVGSGFNPGATQGIFNLPGVRNITAPIGELRDAIGGVGGWNIPYTGQAIPTIAQAGSNFLSSHPLVADFVNAGGVTAAEGIGLGSSLLVGGAAKDAAKTAIAIGDKLAPFHNKVLVPGTRRLAGAIGGFHGNYLVPQGRQFHQNVLVPAGREFHQNVLVPSGNAALDGIQRNLNVLKESAEQQLNIKGQLSAVSESLLPTTRFTGQVGIEENSQLNDHPDTGLGEIDTAPSRLIQEFSDRRISGEGSLTPGDRSDLSALLSGSRGQYGPIEGLKALGPDETVSGDIEIRTDVGVNDPVNFTQLFGKRVGKREKDKFIAGLQERNEDVYSGEGATGMRRGRSSDPEKRFQPFHEVNFGSDLHTPTKGSRKGQLSRLPKRKIEGKGKMGSMGVAGSMAGVADWEDRDAKDPLHGLKQFARGVMEEPDLSDNAAEEVGRRIAEREEQGSTEWVRSPDGKLRRKKIDDPWDS